MARAQRPRDPDRQPGDSVAARKIEILVVEEESPVEPPQGYEFGACDQEERAGRPPVAPADVELRDLWELARTQRTEYVADQVDRPVPNGPRCSRAPLHPRSHQAEGRYP